MKHLLTTIAFAACLTAAAEDTQHFKVDQLWYTILDDNTCAVTNSFDNNLYHDITGTLTVPATVTHADKTYRVTTIEAEGLDNCNASTIIFSEGIENLEAWSCSHCRNLTTIYIPASATNIAEELIGYCEKLTHIYVAPANPAYCDIDGVLFDHDKTALWTFPSAHSASYTVPTGTQTIKKCAFDNSSIQSVTLPTTLRTIGRYAFSQCQQLTDITIPEGTQTIGGYAFWSCYHLYTLTLPSTLQYIGEQAFYNCCWLTNIYSNATTPATADYAAFSDISYNFTNSVHIPAGAATLHIPVGTTDAYKAADWNSTNLTTYKEEATPAPFCATPTITYADGEYSFACNTPGAKIEYYCDLYDYQDGANLTYDAASSENVGYLQLPTSRLYVWATAPGYEPSRMAAHTVSFLPGDANADGTLSVGDITTLIKKLNNN